MFSPSLARLASTIRPNKRAVAASSSKTLSSLISVYHQTSNFAPLTATGMTPYIIETFLPKNPKNPMVNTVKEMSLNNKLMIAEAGVFDRTSSVVGMDLNASFDTNYHFAETESNSGYQHNFEKAFTAGFEPPFRRRSRLVMDTLHGTTNGGQAGLLSVLEARAVQSTQQELEVAMERRALEAARRELAEEEQREKEERFDSVFREEESTERR